MKGLRIERLANVILILIFAATAFLPVIFSSAVDASVGVYLQNARPTAAPTPPAADKPPYSAYKGVSIGTSADETRTKLGIPKEKSDAQDYFVFTENESVQIYYDATHTVTAISITYIGDLKDAPTAKDVFGVDVAAKPDGGVFKMVRYPKAGFWISYNRTGGDDPLIMIAIQKF